MSVKEGRPECSKEMDNYGKQGKMQLCAFAESPRVYNDANQGLAA